MHKKQLNQEYAPADFNTKDKEIENEIEKTVFHIVNGNLLRAGIISQEIYEKAKVLIDRL